MASETGAGDGAQWAFEEGKKYPRLFHAEGDIPAAVLVSGELQWLEQFSAAPRDLGASVRLDNQQSFCDYVKAFTGPGTRIFADRTKHLVEAVLDYHEPGSPHWGRHKAELPYGYDPAFNAWKAVAGTWHSQAQFADFLDERQDDVRESDLEKLLAVVNKLEITCNTKWSSAIRGDGRIELKTEHTQDVKTPGRVEIPTKIQLRVPVFVGTQERDVTVRISYRVSEGAAHFAWSILRIHELLAEEFERECMAIQEELGVPLHFGVIKKQGL